MTGIITDNLGRSSGLIKSAAAGESNKPYFRASLGSTQDIGTTGSWNKLEIDTVQYDSGSFFDSTTEYRWEPTVAGKYFIYGSATIYGGNGTFRYGNIMVGKYGSSTEEARGGGNYSSNYGYILEPYAGSIVDMDGSNDYCAMYVLGYTGGATVNVEAGVAASYFGGFLLTT